MITLLQLVKAVKESEGCDLKIAKQLVDDVIDDRIQIRSAKSPLKRRLSKKQIFNSFKKEQIINLSNLQKEEDLIKDRINMLKAELLRIQNEKIDIEQLFKLPS